ncbi:hypothetical protein BD410DRAFT_121624 [Rickenella mellea]|uniref:Uncharacterized protein n=1 Tax=Rickenella mellea TaxID=50990 RepID=A0A4Y7PJE4_9AGAM|nr:hypothetical protein BD410DRAFT_121624 [Rickenella mellea]
MTYTGLRCTLPTSSGSHVSNPTNYDGLQQSTSQFPPKYCDVWSRPSTISVPSSHVRQPLVDFDGRHGTFQLRVYYCSRTVNAENFVHAYQERLDILSFDSNVFKLEARQCFQHPIPFQIPARMACDHHTIVVPKTDRLRPFSRRCKIHVEVFTHERMNGAGRTGSLVYWFHCRTNRFS